MNLQVVAAFDKKARVYLTPFFVKTIEVAVRSLSSAVNTEARAEIYDHPEDFSLWHIGSYNDDSGKITVFPEPVHVAEAIQLKKVTSVQHQIS